MYVLGILLRAGEVGENKRKFKTVAIKEPVFCRELRHKQIHKQTRVSATDISYEDDKTVSGTE